MDGLALMHCIPSIVSALGLTSNDWQQEEEI